MASQTLKHNMYITVRQRPLDRLGGMAIFEIKLLRTYEKKMLARLCRKKNVRLILYQSPDLK